MSRRRYRMDVASSPSDTALVHAELARQGWVETAGDDWDLRWTFDVSDEAIFGSATPDQRINHFPGTITLHSKDELYFFLKRAADRVGARAGVYDFFPRTFSMPGEYDEWRSAADNEPDTIWIVKPKRLMGGQGVRVLTDLDSVERHPHWIVQEYLADPFLLPDYPFKHILRLYVLVTSLDPLVAYLYGDGLAKFTSLPFGRSAAELADPVRHVTNNVVQQTNTTVIDPIRCLDLNDYGKKLREAGHDPEPIWANIRRLLAQTLIAHRQPMLTLTERISANPIGCFELLGFDVMLDAALKPWIIECNMSPALGNRGRDGSEYAATHHRVKEPLIADMLAMISARPARPGYGSAAFEAERSRCGAFELLFPAGDRDDLLHCFDAVSDADVELHRWL